MSRHGSVRDERGIWCEECGEMRSGWSREAIKCKTDARIGCGIRFSVGFDLGSYGFVGEFVESVDQGCPEGFKVFFRFLDIFSV